MTIRSNFEVGVWLTDGDGDERFEMMLFPGTMEACERCRATGRVLIGGYEGTAFTSDEVCGWSEEEEAAYFNEGSYLHRNCPDCKGQRVLTVIDWEEAKGAMPEEAKAYEEQLEEERRDQATYEAERRAGC